MFWIACISGVMMAEGIATKGHGEVGTSYHGWHRQMLLLGLYQVMAQKSCFSTRSALSCGFLGMHEDVVSFW